MINTTYEFIFKYNWMIETILDIFNNFYKIIYTLL